MRVRPFPSGATIRKLRIVGRMGNREAARRIGEIPHTKPGAAWVTWLGRCHAATMIATGNECCLTRGSLGKG